MTRGQGGGLTGLRQRPPINGSASRPTLSKTAEGALLRRVGEPQAANAARPTQGSGRRPEIGPGTVEEARGVEAAVQVDVRVQQDRRERAQVITRIVDYNSGARIYGVTD